MANQKRSKLLEIAKYMPPLYHKFPDQEFDIKNSEVIKWLAEQPEFLNYIWNNVKNSKSIIFDSSTGKWQGVEYHD